MTKENKSLKVKTSSRRKFFKTAAKTGALAAAAVAMPYVKAVSYTHLRAHETSQDLVCRLLLEKKKM